METAICKKEQQIALRGELSEKLEALKDAGFPNCKNAQDLQRQIDEINFDRYKSKYPHYLFFTDNAFDEIVKRNKLVISDSGAYTGHIPDHCLDAIVNENIDENDIRQTKYKVTIVSSTTKFSFSFNCNAEERDAIRKWTKENVEQRLLQYGLDDEKLYSYKINEKLYSSDYAMWPTLYDSRRYECVFDISFTKATQEFSLLYIEQKGMAMDTTPDPRFGLVKLYPASVLDEVFNKSLNEKFINKVK
jgi:hypothetical protein